MHLSAKAFIDTLSIYVFILKNVNCQLKTFITEILDVKNRAWNVV